MLAYRFMAMDMRELQSGTTALETADVLKDFMMVPTQMDMKMHILGVMFAPHIKTFDTTRTGKKYHRSSRRYLKYSKIPVSLEKAKQNYTLFYRQTLTWEI